MVSQVDLQLTAAIEAFPAGFTNVRLLTCVDSQVDFQIRITAETFAAKFARKRLLARVTSHVDCQPIVSSKTLTAQLARVRLFARVGSCVSFHVELATETFSTGLTSKGLLTCVGAYVSHQVEVTAKSLSARFAGVKFFIRVLILRLRHYLKHFCINAALHGLQAAVSVMVRFQYELLFPPIDGKLLLFLFHLFSLCLLIGAEFLVFLFDLWQLSCFLIQTATPLLAAELLLLLSNV